MPQELVVREYVGGVCDGDVEIVHPEDSKDEVHRRSKYWPDDERNDLPEAESEDVYEFSHEEVAVVTLRKWVFVRKTAGRKSSAD